jgi:hypothetical protein
VPDRGVGREQALDDPRPQPGGDSTAVAFEAELVLQRPDDRLNLLEDLIEQDFAWREGWEYQIS